MQGVRLNLHMTLCQQLVKCSKEAPLLRVQNHPTHRKFFDFVSLFQLIYAEFWRALTGQDFCLRCVALKTRGD